MSDQADLNGITYFRDSLGYRIALEAEVERLRESYDRRGKRTEELTAICERFRAEVERLRAGFRLCVARLDQDRSLDMDGEIEAYCQAAEAAGGKE